MNRVCEQSGRLYTVGGNVLVDVRDLSVVSVPVAVGVEPVLSPVVRVWSLIKPPGKHPGKRKTNKTDS